jgi:hypothetical protein
MTEAKSRNYNCKDEELPVICNFVLFSLKRDLAEFSSFSQKFNEGYVTGFETKINGISDLVEPKSETVQLKTITDGVYTAMDGLIDPINRVTGYMTLGKLDKTISVADFGLTQLRKSINTRDGENVMKCLHTVNLNLVKFSTELSPQGLSADLTDKFSTALTVIAEGKQKQYEIVSNRKSIVQNNLSVLNDLYSELCEILAVGKILYKATDSVKLQEYSFSELKKQVRKTVSPTNVAAAKANNATPAN